MRESFATLEFDITSRAELDDFLEFDRAQGLALALKPSTGVLQIHDGPETYECLVTVRRHGRTLLLSTEVPSLPASIVPFANPLRNELAIDDWEQSVRSFPAGSAEYELEISYEKSNDVGASSFVIFTKAGGSAVRKALRERMKLEGGLSGFTIHTPLVAAPIISDGVLIAPIGSASTRKSSEMFLCPDNAPEDLGDLLAGVQTDHVGLCVLQRDFGEETVFDLAVIRELAAWIQGHKFRRALVRRHLEGKDLPQTNNDIGALTRALDVLEDELVGGALRTFESASATFREISVELLRDLHKMRGEILSLVGSELFQMCVTMAVVIAGLTIKDLAAIPVVYGVALLVGLVFFAGAVLKVRTQEREFRNLLEFNREFDRLPVGRAMPEFHAWYVRTVERSIDSFYASISIGVPIAGVPLYGAAALAINAKWPSVPGWLAFTLLATGGAGAGLAYWKRGGWRHLRVAQAPRGRSSTR